MEQNIKDYQKIVIDHYENLTNDVDIYHQSLKQGEFDREREEITKLIEEYREKNLNQVNNVKLDIEKTKNLAPFKKRDLLDELIFKDAYVSSIKSSDSKNILIIYPCYLSVGAKLSIRKRLFESNPNFYLDLNKKDAIIVSLIINIYEATKSCIIEIGNFKCENLSIWSDEDFSANYLAEFLKKFNIKTNNLILNSTFFECCPNIPAQILSEDWNSLKSLQINNSTINFLDDNNFSNLKDLEILNINRCYLYFINDGFLNGLIKLRDLRISFAGINQSLKKFPIILRPEQFKDLKNLKVLEISNAYVKEINDSTFINLNNLVHLDLSGNCLLEILAKTFEGLKNLKSLNLENNKIFSIYDNAFSDSRNLERINLSNNKIEFLFSDTFYGLKCLKYLDIKGNLLHPENHFDINGCTIKF